MTSFIEEATHQRDCHAQQVSGVWSINAKEFCEKTGIPDLYDAALLYQYQCEHEDNLNYQEEELSKYTSRLGELTPAQMEKLAADCEDVGKNDDGYSYYFWDYIVKKLENAKG